MRMSKKKKLINKEVDLLKKYTLQKNLMNLLIFVLN